MMNQTRIAYLDSMKGLAILLVVIGHVMQFSFGKNPSDVVTMLSIFHMPIFFYISGYLLYKEPSSFKDMITRLAKRAASLLVPYFVFLALWSIFSDVNYVSLVFMGGERYWFLWILFQLSIFFMFYGYTISGIKKDWIYITLLIIPYLFLILIKIFNMGGVNHLVTYYRYFLIGFLCKKYSVFNNLMLRNEIVYATGFIMYFLQWRYSCLHNMVLIFMGGIGAIVVLQRLFVVMERSHKSVSLLALLSKVGTKSLSVYVLHYYFIPDVERVVSVVLDVGNPFIWQLTLSLLLSVPIVAASIFIGQLIESNKYLNLLFFGKIFK